MPKLLSETPSTRVFRVVGDKPPFPDGKSWPEWDERYFTLERVQRIRDLNYPGWRIEVSSLGWEPVDERPPWKWSDGDVISGGSVTRWAAIRVDGKWYTTTMGNDRSFADDEEIAMWADKGVISVLRYRDGNPRDLLSLRRGNPCAEVEPRG